MRKTIKKKAIFIICLACLALIAPHCAFAVTLKNAVTIVVLAGIAAGGLTGALLAAPAAIPYVAGAALLGTLGGVYYSHQPSSSTNKPYASPSGGISAPANAVWVDLVNGVPTAVKADITSSLSYADVSKILTNNPGLYPQLQSAFFSMIDPKYPPLDPRKQPNQGDTFAYNGVRYAVGGSQGKYGMKCDGSDSPSPPGVEPGGSTVWFLYGAGTSCTGERRIMVNLGAYQPVKTPNTPAQTAKKLTQPTSYAPKADDTITIPAGVYSDYYGDIDSMIHDNPNVVHFEDGPASNAGSNTPMVAPSAPSASQLAAGIASTAASEAASAAASAASNAGNAYAASGGNPATGQGGDPALYQKYLDALAAQKTAQAAADKAASDEAAQQDTGTDDSTYSGTFDGSTPYGDQSKDFNFGTRFQTFINQMKNTAIFSLPNQFLANIPSSSTSTMSFSGGRFGQFTYDFAQFNGVFAVLKAIVLVLFGWVSIKIVLLKGGSQ